MYKYIKILVLSCVSILNLFQLTFGNSFCDTNSKITQAFNLGGNLYLGQNSKSIWKFDPNVKQIIDEKLDFKTVFGEIFYWADTAFTFDFDDCDPYSKGQTYCEDINTARDLVVAIGSRKDLSDDPNDNRRYGYYVRRFADGKGLIPVKDNYNDYIVWGLKSIGSLRSSFWVELTDNLNYESSVFVKSRNLLIVSVFDTTKYSDNIMSRKLEDNGQWSKGWNQLAKGVGFRGMFVIKDRVFGFDKQNIVFEFLWKGNDDKNLDIQQISKLNELLNCYDNSSLWERIEQPVITKSTTTTTTTTESTPLPEITANSVTNSSRSDGSAEKLDEKEIPLKTDIINLETTEPEVELLLNITENTTHYESQMNQKLEESTDNKDVEEGTDWSAVFIIAILVLIIIIVIALAIIIRNKSKSRILYMNPKESEESKSAEIPLNNNNDKSVNTKDV